VVALTTVVTVPGSFDPVAGSIFIYLRRPGTKGVAFDVHAVPEVPETPGERPRDVFLSIDHSGHVARIMFGAAPIPGSGDAGTLRLSFPLHQNEDGSVEVVIDETVVPTRRLLFDWPGEAPRWFAWARADRWGRLHSVTFARPEETLDPFIVQSVQCP
jgi:hypothetical protein